MSDSREATQEIRVNGEAKAVPKPLTVAGLLTHLGIETGPVAVERNRKIVPKARHGDTPVEAGDQLEIVTLVGGG
jgi:thiamine biosynthesis protein ThiS